MFSTSLPPNKPQRPLSAYNLFFRLERERILLNHSKLTKNDDAPSIPGGSKISAEDVAKISDKKRYGVVRRQDRKKHGKIGFAELAKLIAKKWKEISQSEKSLLEERAAEEKMKYKKLMREYTKNLREYEKQVRNKQADSYASLPLAVTSLTAKKVIDNTPQRNKYYGRGSCSDGAEPSLYGNTANEHHQQQRMFSLHQEQENYMRQQQRLKEHASMAQLHQASVMQQMMNQRDSYSVTNDYSEVDTFERMTGDAFFIGSKNDETSMHQQTSSHDHCGITMGPIVQPCPEQELYHQSQPLLAFAEEETEGKEPYCSSGFSQQLPTNDHWTFVSHCDGNVVTRDNSWSAQKHEKDSNADMMSSEFLLPNDVPLHSEWQLDHIDSAKFWQ